MYGREQFMQLDLEVSNSLFSMFRTNTLALFLKVSIDFIMFYINQP